MGSEFLHSCIHHLHLSCIDHLHSLIDDGVQARACGGPSPPPPSHQLKLTLRGSVWCLNAQATCGGSLDDASRVCTPASLSIIHAARLLPLGILLTHVKAEHTPASPACMPSAHGAVHHGELYCQRLLGLTATCAERVSCLMHGMATLPSCSAVAAHPAHSRCHVLQQRLDSRGSACHGLCTCRHSCRRR